MLLKMFYHKILGRIKDFYYRCKWAGQIIFTGECDWDMINADYTLTCRILPVLERFKECACTYPESRKISTFYDWMICVDKMIRAFDLMKNDDEWDLDEIKKQEVEEGLNLFAEYYTALWD